MTNTEHRDAKMPPNFHRSLYDALMQWYGRMRAGNWIVDDFGIPESCSPNLVCL